MIRTLAFILALFIASPALAQIINVQSYGAVGGGSYSKFHNAGGQFQFIEPIKLYGGIIAGVTCSGPPTASYAVTNGVVTHC